ncbi:MAG: hypothetical protein QG639_1141 [Patescibacteria group bacterium]|nr:hypothetical protein [Patescibacteria group bacterium]
MANNVATTIASFFTQFKHQQFGKGEIVIRSDDEPLGIYYILNGTVKEYAISVKGEESVITLFKAGSFFPMSWALHPGSNKYYYEAVNDAEVYRAPADKVTEFLKNNPEVLLDLLTRVYSGLEALSEKLVYLMSGSAKQRLALELIIIAKRFGTKRIKNNTMYYQTVIGEKDLAAQTGLARETVSRELQSLKKFQAVLIDKSEILINLELLEKELQGNN